MARQFSDKEINSDKVINNLSKESNKSDDKIFLKSENSHGDISKIKVYDNMTGMDKVDGMAGKTAGIGQDSVRGDVRPEDGMYIYSGGLNLDVKKK